jgi:large subunit ribosomal protein L5
VRGMRNIKIEKITLNIGCGTTTSLEQAKTILEQISKSTVVITKTSKRTTFNVPKGKSIGCKTTLRKDVDEFLKRMLVAKDNRLTAGNFDNSGNFSFGIKEYIDVPGAEYDPKLKILGFDVCVTLERPGYRVKRKRLASKIGKKHKITKEDAIKFVQEKFGTKVE